MFFLIFLYTIYNISLIILCQTICQTCTSGHCREISVRGIR